MSFGHGVSVWDLRKSHLNKSRSICRDRVATSIGISRMALSEMLHRLGCWRRCSRSCSVWASSRRRWRSRSLDSTLVKVHSDATEARKVHGPRAIGKSRGSWTTKVHRMAADARCTGGSQTAVKDVPIRSASGNGSS